MSRITEKYRKDKIDETFLKKFNLSLADLEKEYISAHKPSDQPVLFICGAPRSGTTLITQVLARTGHFNYIDNFVARFWRVPFVGFYIEKLIGLRDLFDNKDFTFKSDFGRTSGILDPHEFSYFWEYWLRPEGPNHVILLSHLKKIDVKGLRKEINAILNFYNMPLFFKNVWFMGNPSLAYKLFPHAFFIIMKRDVLSNALSILKARIQYHGNEKKWFSLKPTNYKKLKNMPTEYQIIGQIKGIYNDIETQSSGFRERTMVITCEELCNDPVKIVKRIANKFRLNKHDTFALQNRLPKSFISNKISYTSAFFKKFEDALKNV
jgi:hypothetical protein